MYKTVDSTVEMFDKSSLVGVFASQRGELFYMLSKSFFFLGIHPEATTGIAQAQKRNSCVSEPTPTKFRHIEP